MPQLPIWVEMVGPWLPVFIFCARIVDVSLGTFRTICVVRGHRVIAAGVGFFEVLAWLGAISSVVSRLDQPLNIVAYAGGFATGNWVGMFLENKLALGHQIVRLISRDPEGNMASLLRQAGYAVTELQGEGRDSSVTICFVATSRKHVRALLAAAKSIDPQVFSTVEDVREVSSLPQYRQISQKTGWRAVFKK
jgi:uncharacterized protein YebE (UPF0316 family)